MIDQRFPWRPDQLAPVVDRVGALPPRLGRSRLVLIDGPSGSGKTTYAQALAQALEPDVQLVHTDDLLDGWEDQFTYWERLERLVLEPVRQGRAGRYRPYDWHAGRFGDRFVAVRPAGVVIVEGVGAARAAGRQWAVLTVFLDAAEPVRIARTLARDGAELEPYLRRWRELEDRHFTQDATAAHADLIIDSGNITGGIGPAAALRSSHDDPHHR